MSMRLKAVLFITSAIALITTANFGMIMLFTQHTLGKTVETDLSVIARVVDDCMTSETDSLVMDAASMARHLSTVSHDGFERTFDEQEIMYLSVPLAGSYDEGVIGNAEPLAKNPIAHLRHELLVSELVLLAVGTLAAALVSKRVVRPVEENYRRNKELVELKTKAERVSEMKSAFLANTSHEMRTPLNAIIGLSELQLLEQHDAATHTDLTRIHHAGTILLSIINDILDISKIESGRFNLVTTDYDVANLINDAVTMSMMRKGSKPIEFDLRVHEEMPTRLYGDELRIKQIFNNLLSNAFKYTQEGTVTWRIGFERCPAPADESAAQPAETVYLVSSVTDTGIGIKPDDIKKLFSDYNQVDVKSNRSIEGTGLGLAITRRLVEAMGGSIEVQSVYGKGSTFTFRIPQGFVTDEPIGAVTAANLRSFQYIESRGDSPHVRVDIQLPHIRVLIVDDNQTNLAVAQGMLGLYGMQIDCADSGAKALELIREETPIYQAIFMDHMMPGMDGIETFERIRGLGTEYAARVPIIALTANAITGNAEMFESKGFAAFLSKPIDRAQLDTIIQRWLCDGGVSDPTELSLAPPALCDGGAPNPTELSPVSSAPTVPKPAGTPAPPTPLTPPTPTAPPTPPNDLAQLSALGINVASGLEHLGGDSRGYVNVLRLYRVETASLLAKLRGFGSRQLDECAIVAHGIKGSSRGIGADELAKAAEELEMAAKAGDWQFVQEKNAPFREQAETLIAGMEKALNLLELHRDAPGKKNKKTPDRRALKRLCDAAADFSIDGIENALCDLEGYDYQSGGELVVWLRGKCDVLAFDEIAARLSGQTALHVTTESDDSYQEAS